MATAQNLLGWLDYSMLGLTLGLSTLVGSYFGFVKKKTPGGSKAAAYLDGGHNLKVVPVTVSICASTVSSIGFLGVATEMYEYGAHHWIGCFSTVTGGMLALYLFLPVLFNLRVSSAYEYLELRFSKHVRSLTSLLFILDAILYSGIVMFISSLALAKMSGISLHLINLISCCVCGFYTMVGGIQGVIWTDTIQAWMMVGSLITIIVIGLNNIGGISKLAAIVEKGNHLQLDYSLTPFLRTSVLTATTGQVWYNVGTTFLNQSNIQRFNSLSSLRDLKWTVLLVGFGCFFLLTLSHLCGLVLYGIYADCDPITAKIIDKPEQLLPMFVLEYAGNIPAFPGIFIAGLFSAGLSTMSAKLNSVAGVIYNDFIRQIYHKPISDARATLLMKLSVLAVGILCLLMGFAVEYMGQMVQLCITLQSIGYGAMTGLFTLGMLFPRSNTKGAVCGGIAGAIAVGWICAGTQRAIGTGALVYAKLPTSIEGCTNVTTPILTPNITPEEPFILFKLSFMYYCMVGTAVTVAVGSLVSYLFPDGHSHKDVPLEYLSPPLQRYLKSRQKPSVELKPLNDLQIKS